MEKGMIGFIIAILISGGFLFNADRQAEEEMNTAEAEREKPSPIAIQEHPDEKSNDKILETISEKEEELEAVSEYIIVIDPGHQTKANYEQEPVGPGHEETKIKVSQGTRGVRTGTMEYELNLQVSFLLKEILEDRGIEVVMTRVVNDVDISNKERAEMANEVNADLFVRIHADGAASQAARGAHVLIPDESHSTPGVYQSSKKAANRLLHHLEAEGIQLHSNPLTRRGDISGFNWSEVPVFLFEMGFMTNPEEDLLLADTAYQIKLMTITANAIEDNLKENK